jgi:uncharacterized lipoprotein YbaY
MSVLAIQGVIRNGRVEVSERIALPEGTQVVVSPVVTATDDGPMSPDEIARVHSAMQKLLPLEIPDEVAADLDEWERKINQYGITNSEKGLEDVFR